MVLVDGSNATLDVILSGAKDRVGHASKRDGGLSLVERYPASVCRWYEQSCAEVVGAPSRPDVWLHPPVRHHQARIVESIIEPLTAITREKQIKRWTRVKKLALIDAYNPGWYDLAERYGLTRTPPDPSLRSG